MPGLDRQKEALATLARGAVFDDYSGVFRAKVLKQHPNRRRVDVQPEDPRLPAMSNIPLRVGVPGVEVVILPGHQVLVGFDNGWPDRPYATGWVPGDGGTVPAKLTLNAQVTELGGTCIPVMDGVVTGMAVDPFTTMPMWMLGNSSTVVGAKK